MGLTKVNTLSLSIILESDMAVLFKQVKTGCTFYCNGNQYLKHSSRTAILTRYGKVFYFGNNESVVL